MPQVPQEPVTIRPIGVVVSDFSDFDQKTNYEDEKEIFIREELELGLTGLEHFSHIYVLYHQHRRKEWQQSVGWAENENQILTMPLSGEPSCKGIYTTRAPARPSGIGSCICELLHRDGNRLIVKGLDAFGGTAVLDIKIYLPRYDSFPEAAAPLHWCATHPLGLTSKTLHWDTMNVGMTLGMRAGLKALQLLGLSRGEAQGADVVGGNFFAQGIEGVTGCSVLRDTMTFTEKIRPMGDWTLHLVHEGRTASIGLRDQLYQGADEVLCAPDDRLFSTVGSL